MVRHWVFKLSAERTQLAGSSDKKKPTSVHDGAPQHFHNIFYVRNYLHKIYPDKRERRNAPVAWPLQSPKLTLY